MGNFGLESTFIIKRQNIFKTIKEFIDFLSERRFIIQRMRELGSAEAVYREMVEPYILEE